MTSYELMLLLREEKVLYKYLEHVSLVVTPDNETIIIGDSDYGECTTKVLSTDVIRLCIPIKYSKSIPLNALERVLVSLQDSIEGLLVMELDSDNNPFIQYVIHCTIDKLSAGLIRFAEDNCHIEKSIANVSEMFSNINKSLTNKSEAKSFSFNGKPLPSNQSNKADNVWDVIEDIDKQTRIDLTEEFDDLEDYLDEDDDFGIE